MAWEQYRDSEARTCDKAVIWCVKKRRKLPAALIGRQTLGNSFLFLAGESEDDDRMKFTPHYSKSGPPDTEIF
jgi:hypothetical protein